MNLKIINIIFSMLMLALALFSCTNSLKKLLCKQWKTIALKNSTFEKRIQEMSVYIDTLGENDAEFRKSIDVDSVKQSLRYQLSQTILEQKVNERNTVMEFRQNGISYTKSTDGIDSAMYSIEDHFIKIDEAKLKGFGETMTFEILKLTKDSLCLRLVDYGDTSLITMIPTH